MKRILIACGCVLGLTGSVVAADIVWVSFHSADNTPGAAAAAAGFTQAPDIGYTNLLSSAGHNVTRIVTVDNEPPQSTLDVLNAADLVILGRSVNSGHYQTDAETLFWNNKVTAPLMAMSAFTTRGGATAGNQRLGYFTGDTIPDIGGTRRVTAVNPAHPVFNGITLDGSNQTGDVIGLANSPVNGAAQRGASMPTQPPAGVGSVIATLTGGAPEGGFMIAEWPAGSSTDVNIGDVFGGNRMVFFSGSREVSGVDSQTAGILDLTPVGQQMFLNAVAYMGGPSIPLIPGDTDGDQVVELEDFFPIRDNFRKNVTMRTEGDLVRDGVVNFLDFREWKAAFLGGGGSVAGADLGFASVPEPSCFVLVLFGLLSLVTRRRLRPH